MELGAVHRRTASQYERRRSRSESQHDYLFRPGGGAAYRVKDTGGWRPAVTHHTRCPNCNKIRNVAVLHEMDSGIFRVNCEWCGYQWLHRVFDAPMPLTRGTSEAFRPRVAGGKYQHAEAM